MSGLNAHSLNQSFLDYWSLSKSVFSSPGWEKGLFIPKSKETILQRVKLYSDRRGAVISLTAPHGHGKTTMARWIYDSLSLQQHEAIFLTLYKPENNAGWLLPRLCEFFGITMGTFQATQSDIVEDIAAHVEEIQEEGRQLTLIIDEADKIQTNDAFAEIHALVSIHSAIETCINVILIGGNELTRRLEASPAIMSRLVFHAHYDPLTLEETDAYLNYRLDGAQLEHHVITPDARRAIAGLSGGIYGLINTLGDNSLVECYLSGKRIVDQEMVEKAASFLNLAVQKGKRIMGTSVGDSTNLGRPKESPGSSGGQDEAAIAPSSPLKPKEKTNKESKGTHTTAHVGAKAAPKGLSNNEASGKEPVQEKKNGALSSLFYKDKDDES